MRGIIGYGSYVPYHRLDRQEIAVTLGSRAGGGSRSVASYDEDTTSLAVEAGRNALTSLPGVLPERLLFATASPAYLDKNNASAIHAALRLPTLALAVDTGGALRSGVASLLLALEGRVPTLVVASDIRTGRPGNAEEAAGGDAAAAVLVGDDSTAPVLAELIGQGTATAELMDRWRIPGETTARVWEERFAASVYPPLVEQAVTDGVKDAGITPAQIDKLIVAGAHSRAVAATARLAPSPEALVNDLSGIVGNSGTAHAALLLCAALETAEPGQVIALVNLADGVDVLVLRTTDAIATTRPKRTVADWLAASSDSLPYASFLTWRGFLERQGPRRPDPTGPSAPPAARAADWKFGFVGSRDRTSGAINLPPQRISFDDGRVDDSEPVPMADVPAKVVTFSIDRLAYSMAPPVVMAVVDFEGGGRLQCELTDVDPGSVKVGTPVEMSFRRTFTADGVHNYFWKGRPLRQPAPTEGER